MCPVTRLYANLLVSLTLNAYIFINTHSKKQQNMLTKEDRNLLKISLGEYLWNVGNLILCKFAQELAFQFFYTEC